MERSSLTDLQIVAMVREGEVGVILKELTRMRELDAGNGSDRRDHRCA